MRNKKFLIVYFFVIAISVSGYLYYRSDLFPAVFVNWNIVTQKTINEYYNLSMNYLSKTVPLYNSDPKALESQTTRKEIKAAIIEKMIEDILIYKEVKSRVGNELDTIANQKIDNALKEKNIEDAVNTLFETTMMDYTQKELKPQAYKEILQGRMTLTNEDFDKWLENSKAKANILIFIPGYSWDGKNVKIK